MANYRVEGCGSTVRDRDSIDEALTCAKSLVYLPEKTLAQRKIQLEATGATGWAYGFSTVTIQRLFLEKGVPC